MFVYSAIVNCWHHTVDFCLHIVSMNNWSKTKLTNWIVLFWKPFNWYQLGNFTYMSYWSSHVKIEQVYVLPWSVVTIHTIITTSEIISSKKLKKKGWNRWSGIWKYFLSIYRFIDSIIISIYCCNFQTCMWACARLIYIYK